MTTTNTPTTYVSLARLARDEHVLSVYSGKAGACMCGCSGKHYYHPSHRWEAGASRGYEVDEDECNKGMITRVLKVLRSATDVKVDTPVGDGGDIVYATVDGRDYVAYLRRGVRIPKRTPAEATADADPDVARNM
jgi:hypothetical protein